MAWPAAGASASLRHSSCHLPPPRVLPSESTLPTLVLHPLALLQQLLHAAAVRRAQAGHDQEQAPGAEPVQGRHLRLRVPLRRGGEHCKKRLQRAVLQGGKEWCAVPSTQCALSACLPLRVCASLRLASTTHRHCAGHGHLKLQGSMAPALLRLTLRRVATNFPTTHKRTNEPAYLPLLTVSCCCMPAIHPSSLRFDFQALPHAKLPQSPLRRLDQAWAPRGSLTSTQCRDAMTAERASYVSHKH